MDRKSLVFMGVAMLVLTLDAAFASDVLVWQGQFYTDATFNMGVHQFNFTVFDALEGGEICYNNVTTLATGYWGEWKTEQINVSSSCNNASKDYFLEIEINGVPQHPRRRITVWDFLRKGANETTSGSISAPVIQTSDIQFVDANDSSIFSMYVAGQSLIANKNITFTGNVTANYLRLGHPANVPSEGLIAFGKNIQDAVMSSANFSYAMLEPQGLGFYNSLNSVADYFFKVNSTSLFFKNDSWVKTFEVDRQTGNVDSAGNVTAAYFVGDGSQLTGMTKEMFFPALPGDSTYGFFITEGVNTGGSWNYNFMIPSDFSSLVSLDVIFIPEGANAAAAVTLDSDYGAVGEAYNQHSQTLSTTWNIGTADLVYAKDISGLFSNLNAGDFCGIEIDHTLWGFTTHYLGIRLRYKT